MDPARVRPRRRPDVRLAVVVVHYRTPAETVAAVQSLRAGCRVPDDIVVVDNGSGDLPVGGLGDGTRVIGMAANVGFSAGANAGIRAALGVGIDAVLLLNSDAAVAPECLARLEAALVGRGAGIAGAAVHTRTGHRGTVVTAGIRYSLRSGRVRETRTLPAMPTAVDAVSGCAMLVGRSTFERIGFFAEEYFFSFEDVDFCLRARAAGLEVVLVPDATVMHDGSRSIGRRAPERLYFAARNHLLLAERIGPGGRAARRLREVFIVALNVAHALFTAEAPLRAGLRSVCRGVGDHARGRYGAPSLA